MTLQNADWSIAANGNIRSVSGTTTHKVIELHRWLMDKLDNASSSGDDLLDVTAGIIPSTRKTDNIIVLNSPYNIDDTAAERFYDGSIEQDGGNTLYSGLQVVGSTRLGTTELQLVQNNALLTNYWGTGINVDASANILLQMLVKTRASGADIDGKRLRVQAREVGDTFAYFQVTLGNGVSVAAIFTNADDFNTTAAGTIATWTDITNSEGLQAIDVDSNGSTEQYYGKWDVGARTRNQLYERAKWLTRRGTASTVYGMNGDLFLGITHSFAYTTEGGTWPLVQNEVLSWGTGATAGTGAMLALDDQGTTGFVYIQLLTGVPPAASATVTGTGGGTCVVNGSPTARTVNANCFLGNYTGALAGAYGVGVDPADLVATDNLRAFDDVARNPPNNVHIIATGLVSGDIMFSAETKTHSTTVSGAHDLGDTTLTLASGVPSTYKTLGRIMVNAVEHIYTAVNGTDVTIAAPGLKAALSGGETVTVTQINDNRYTCSTASGAYNDVGDTIIQFTVAPGLSWPSSGKVRIWNTSNGWFEVYSYSAISGQQLTGISPALSRDISDETGFIPYIDESASGASIDKTIVYPGSDIQGRHRLYNSAGNIVPFEVPFTVGSTGASSQMVRGNDA